MIDYFYLVPIAIGMGLVGLASFMWTLRNGQYDDLEAQPNASCSRATRVRSRISGIPPSANRAMHLRKDDPRGTHAFEI